MAKKTFLIELIVYDIQDFVLYEGKMRAKNQDNDFMAKCGLEDFLKKKYVTFDRMVVKSCKEDNSVNDIFKSFNDIFGGFNK